MRIRFSPPWEVLPDIDKASCVKKLDLLQAEFFNWLYECPNGFTSKHMPQTDPVSIYKQLMAPPVAPLQYYDQVLKLVSNGSEVKLSDLYGEACTENVRWVFTQRDDVVVARLVVTVSNNGFPLTADVVAKKTFCAELFKFMRKRIRVVDDTFSTSTQFAMHESLTQLYACHLTNKVS